MKNIADIYLAHIAIYIGKAVGVRVQFAKYVVAGGLVTLVNLSVLYTLTEFTGMYYILSETCGFLASLLVSFFLQKHWTFGNNAYDRLHVQAAQYFALQMANLACNLMLLYILVEYMYIWYFLAQVIVSLGLAVVTFIIARKYIF